MDMFINILVLHIIHQQKQFSEIIESYASNNGVCLTLTDYNYKHSLYVPNVPKNKKNGNAAWKPNIIISVLNWGKNFK